ncbi:hypothetical protein AJ79_02002 [Helicocarpus griseus UAMH5409]|uniref:Telomeric single stranded DNA binding POT1/Cdc13 domain-containing protein n=1 Tax=Helicocarpus griseus UAMH5409 TaxID=1447875 RepID=A0A2B7Y576_9EURO|nr:hypothetical protein AJ79_02002 [Helicocarpus griseus UAMH5409]
MPVRVITLTGAPRSSALNWDESELLNECWFCRTSVGSLTTAGPVRWRAIAQQEGHHSFPEEEEGGDDIKGYHDTEFLAPGAIERHTGIQSTMSSEDDAGSEFYDQSFAMHEGGDSTMLSGMESFYTDSNFETTLEDTSMVSVAPPSTADNDQHPLPLSLAGHLSDLKDIPNAAYIHAIAPRMIPINLIVAVITIYPRKRVQTRWGHETDVVELVVSDETRSGFRITCWVPVSLKDKSRDDTKRDLDVSISGLRPRDIVLFRSVALNSFRGKVYGQSLKGNMTKVDLLHRRPVDSSDNEGLFTTRVLADQTGDSHPQLMKVRRVRNWILEFISPHVYGKMDEPSSQPGESRKEPCLPPDTQ